MDKHHNISEDYRDYVIRRGILSGLDNAKILIGIGIFCILAVISNFYFSMQMGAIGLLSFIVVGSGSFYFGINLYKKYNRRYNYHIYRNYDRR